MALKERSSIKGKGPKIDPTTWKEKPIGDHQEECSCVIEMDDKRFAVEVVYDIGEAPASTERMQEFTLEHFMYVQGKFEVGTNTRSIKLADRGIVYQDSGINPDIQRLAKKTIK